jgi:hypothetical protein
MTRQQFSRQMAPYAIAVDSNNDGGTADMAGNVWFNTSKPITWTTVIVGAATPVIIPFRYQVKYNLVGQASQ